MSQHKEGSHATPESDADKCGMKSEIDFLRSLADILCPPDGSPPNVRRALDAISTMRMVLSRAPRSENAAIALLKEARPYLDLIAPSVSKERPLVMVVTKCDAEALAKRIDDFTGEKP